MSILNHFFDYKPEVLALDEKALARVLDLYLALLRKVPYSPHATLPEGDGQDLIRYVQSMDLLAEQKDALGKILYLDEQNAVLMTYYRNNVLHVFALPALLASFFLSSSRMSREQILRYTRALYPYLQSELFIRWSLEELDTVVDQWLDAFVEQGLLRVENDLYLRPAPSSRHFVLLTLLSKSIAQTLQRFYMAISLLLNSGQNSISADTMCSQTPVAATRSTSWVVTRVAASALAPPAACWRWNWALISAQRAYEMNSKVISAVDSMMSFLTQRT
mgnify:CR=1 FL=1